MAIALLTYGIAGSLTLSDVVNVDLSKFHINLSSYTWAIVAPLGLVLPILMVGLNIFLCVCLIRHNPCKCCVSCHKSMKEAEYKRNIQEGNYTFNAEYGGGANVDAGVNVEVQGGANIVGGVAKIEGGGNLEGGVNIEVDAVISP